MIKIYFLAMVMFVSTFFAYGQNPVKGKITDKKGEPMPGVSVVVQGTTIAAVTNENGEFEITPPTSEAETGKKP
ncbi:MAG: carboxypeptidase-like regulatory domain-containing protein, partial [Cytophagales bacterium]